MVLDVIKLLLWLIGACTLPWFLQGLKNSCSINTADDYALTSCLNSKQYFFLTVSLNFQAAMSCNYQFASFLQNYPLLICCFCCGLRNQVNNLIRLMSKVRKRAVNKGGIWGCLVNIVWGLLVVSFCALFIVHERFYFLFLGFCLISR